MSRTRNKKGLKTTNQQALAARRMLAIEVGVAVTAVVTLLALVLFAALVPMMDWQRAVLIVIGVVQLVVMAFLMVRIEQIAGFYHCGNCGYDYVPGYGKMLVAPHICRTRYMKCPKCGRRSWQKKKL